MKKRIEVLRQKEKDSLPYIETFEYETKSDADTVMTFLKYLESLETVKNAEGEITTPVAYSCSCLQKKCGACAMKINGRPMLGCAAVLKDLPDEIKIEPLSKFKTVRDLIVDRTILNENLKTLKLHLKSDAKLKDDRVMLAHDASKCIQCGCCLEVCPNFYPGGKFFGMSAIGTTTKILLEEEKKDRKDIAKEFDVHIFSGCGKSLACKNVCPAGLDTEDLLVNSVRMAIWKRK